MEPKTQSLIEQGFEKLTEWVWRDGKIRLASLDWPEISGWIYVFVIDDLVVKYIGLTASVSSIS